MIFPSTLTLGVLRNTCNELSEIRMFRLLGLLLIGLYAAMLIGGQDRGQMRFGLMRAYVEPSYIVQPIVRNDDYDESAVPAAHVAAFVPEKPLMTAAETADAAPLVATPAVAAFEGHVLYVGAKSVNVREGPGKDHAVVDRLPRGEAVLVLAEGEGVDGWSLIRIEGDGVEGYVASRLLVDGE